MLSVAELVKNKKVNFKYYRQGNLMYETECGFEFPVPISDTNDATFPAQEKALFFMRWIRKHVDLVNNAARLASCATTGSLASDEEHA